MEQNNKKEGYPGGALLFKWNENDGFYKNLKKPVDWRKRTVIIIGVT